VLLLARPGGALERRPSDAGIEPLDDQLRSSGSIASARCSMSALLVERALHAAAFARTLGWLLRDDPADPVSPEPLQLHHGPGLSGQRRDGMTGA
jgi:hypothetical protein